MATPTREQLIGNIKAMENQGAPQADIQAYLDTFKGQSVNSQQPITETPREKLSLGNIIPTIGEKAGEFGTGVIKGAFSTLDG